ncbi:MAG: hypothetical protein FWE98_02965 [Oscillospiraceae bacterium]|nr:hypothetical protein [Oscillospiraceae bacterium]
MKKRMVSILLTLALLAGMGGALSVTARAQGEARLPTKKELNAAWFKKRPSAEFNGDIALMAASLAMDESAFRERYGVPGKPLEMERFPAGTFIWGVENPHFKVGSIALGDATLVVVKLDGSGAFGSGQYLVSNFIGYYGYAAQAAPYCCYRVEAGYRSYADAVWETLGGLKSTFECKKNLKLLITGHSMGGAGANLLGVRLEKEGQIAGVKIDRKDIYVYAFESPNVYLDPCDPYAGAEFDNIYNFVNSTDAAVLFMPGQRFGKTYYFDLPDPERDFHHPTYAEYERAIGGTDPDSDTRRIWAANLFYSGVALLRSG